MVTDPMTQGSVLLPDWDCYVIILFKVSDFYKNFIQVSFTVQMHDLQMSNLLIFQVLHVG